MATNKTRAACARKALVANTGHDEEVKADPKSAVVDLLANLMHLCRQRKNLDFNDCLRVARDHFYVESGTKLLPVPEFQLAELGSTYADADDRFVVSLIVGYGEKDDVSTPQQAVGAALGLTTDDDSPDTQWYCFDRKTGILRMIEQREAQEA